MALPWKRKGRVEEDPEVLCRFDSDLNQWMPSRPDPDSRCKCFGVERLDCQSCDGYDYSEEGDCCLENGERCVSHECEAC